MSKKNISTFFKNAASGHCCQAAETDASTGIRKLYYENFASSKFNM